MPIADIKDFAKTHNIPLSAVKCSPKFDTTKGRVSKGDAICHKGWKEKGRFEVGKSKKTPFDESEAYMWMLNLSKAGLYVIDIDVTGDKKAKDALTPEMYENLYNASEYVVETGSKGLHFYYKLPTTIKQKMTNKINVQDFKSLFNDENDGSVDIIFDSIITEGSSYTFDDITYKYVNIKPGSNINEVSESETVWKLVTEYALTESKAKNTIIHPVQTHDCEIEIAEIAEHLDNIKNDKRNWDEWYKMAQTLFNIFQHEGQELFMKWSQKSAFHNESNAVKLWKGLSERYDGTGRTVGSILYLSKEADEDVYSDIRSRYAPVTYKALKELIEVNHFFIQEPKPMYVRIREYDALCYTPTSFKELLMSWNYPVVVKGEERMESFFSKWSRDNSKRQYKRIGYYPNESKCPKYEFNSFVPAKASFLPDCDPVDIKPILDHINIMANHDEASAKFLLQYLAQIVQQPDVLPGMAILLYAEEGAGKDILIDWFGKAVLGDHQYYKVGDIGNMFKGFNALMAGKLLVHSDEIHKQTLTKAKMEDLKRIITNGRITIEKKGVDATSEDSFTRVFMTTNNRDALHITTGSRRFVIYQSSNEKIKDISYFKTLSSFIYQDNVVKAFYDYLMSIDVSDFDHTKRPETNMYNEMKQASMDKVLVWILNSDEDFTEERLKTTEWMVKYNTWAESNKERVYNNTSFGIAMNVLIDKDLGITKTIPNRISHLVIKRNKVLEWMEKEGLVILEE